MKADVVAKGYITQEDMDKNFGLYKQEYLNNGTGKLSSEWVDFFSGGPNTPGYI